jgi:outer membrane receptor protein involved in Fe transport
MHLIKLIKSTVGLQLLLFTFCFTTNAQTGTGKLTGKIKDSATNQSLLGVSVTIKGTSKGVASINDGSYILTLNPGTYTIRYSYSGYNTKDITEVVIKKGETNFIDILLAPNLNQLKGVVVTSTSARKETQSAVYNKQRLSAAASDGISAETISKTPDNNAGQILKRVTGVSVQNDKFVVVRGLGAQYNQTMLNGVAMTSTETDKNAFSFDLIPAAAIDNIVVNKTATPDMPGNFAGGVVQVNTKDFPAKDFFSVALQTGFSDQTYGKDFYSDKRGKAEWLSYGGKSRDLPDNFPTSTSLVNTINLNPQELNRYKKTLQNNLAPVNNGPAGKDLADMNENIQFGYGKTIKIAGRNQLGIVAALTQRKTELIEKETSVRDAQFDLVGYFSDNTRYKYSSEIAGLLNIAYSFGSNKLTFKNLYSNVFKNNFIKRDSLLSTFTIYDNSANYRKRLEGLSYLTEQRSLLNSILAGEHKTGKNKETLLDWNINVTTNSSSFPDTRNFILVVDQNEGYSTGDGGTNFPLYVRASSRSWSNSKDLITGGAFNLSSAFNWGSTKSIIKGGMLFQNRKRTTLSSFIPIEIPFTPGNTGPLIDSVLYPSKYEIVTGVQKIIEEVGNYNANTSLQAAYGSMENKLGKYFRVIWGVRFENYFQSSNVFRPAFYPNYTNYEPLPLRFTSRTELNFLPSVNFIYSPAKKINVRLAYSKTVIRPDLKDLIGTTRFDFQSLQLTTGNPDLKSTAVTNYDFKLEWFPSAGEIISVGAFYKTMLDPIEYGQITDQNLYLDRFAINSGEATVKGIEAEFRKKIDFISFAPWMKNVTLFYNGTLLSSLVREKSLYYSFYNYSPAHSLTGQPKYIINGGISIAAFKNSFEATFSYNRTGDYIDQLGSSDFLIGQQPYGKPLLARPNFILQARDIIDVSIRQAVLKGKGLIKFNVANLLSKPLVIYQDFNGNDKLDAPITFDRNPNGARYGFVTGGIDNISSFTIGQRNFSLAFTYTF